MISITEELSRLANANVETAAAKKAKKAKDKDKDEKPSKVSKTSKTSSDKKSTKKRAKRDELTASIISPETKAKIKRHVKTIKSRIIAPISVKEKKSDRDYDKERGNRALTVSSRHGTIHSIIHHGRRRITVQSSGIDSKGGKGKGHGVALYNALANHAHKLGYELHSDLGTSPSAQRAWEGLKSRGHDVRVDPRSHKEERGGYRTMGDHAHSNLTTDGNFHIPAPAHAQGKMNSPEVKKAVKEYKAKSEAGLSNVQKKKLAAERKLAKSKKPARKSKP